MLNLDLTTDFGSRVARRLREDKIIWLTTVDAHGAPQPNPVWFVWDGETLLIYSQPTSHRLRHLALNPIVSLNFDGDEWGDDIVVIAGEARVDPSAPPATAIPAYLAKYREGIKQIEMTPESFDQSYSVAIRVTPTKVRGY